MVADRPGETFDIGRSRVALPPREADPPAGPGIQGADLEFPALFAGERHGREQGAAHPRGHHAADRLQAGSPDVRTRAPVRRGLEAADRQCLIAETVALAEEEQVFPTQIGLAGGSVRSGQPVARRKGQVEGFVEQRQGVQLSVLDGQGQQRGVDPVGPEPFEEMLGQILVDHEPKVGISAFERQQQPRQQIGAEGGDDAEIERPGQRGRPASRQRDDRIRLREHPPRSGDDPLAGRRDVEPPVRTLEERHPQRLLELPELRAEGRLADVAGLRRAAEVAEIGEGDEIAELPEGHAVGSSNDCRIRRADVSSGRCCSRECPSMLLPLLNRPGNPGE